MKLSQLDANPPQHVLVMGDPGSGKSTLVSQLAEKGWNLIWISMDNGHSVLKKLSPAAQDRIELIVLPDTRDYPVAVDTFRDLFKFLPCSICYIHGKNGCSVCKKDGGGFTNVDLGHVPPNTIVVFDNLSQLSDSYLSLICKGKAVDYKLQLDDWGSLRFHLFKALGDIQVAPFRLVALCHCVEETNTDGSKKIMPAVGSSTSAPKVGGYFDHVVYCNVMNKSHRFGSATTYAMNVLTKSRSDVKIEELKDASDKSGKTLAPSLLPFFGTPSLVTASIPDVSRIVPVEDSPAEEKVAAEIVAAIPDTVTAIPEPGMFIPEGVIVRKEPEPLPQNIPADSESPSEKAKKLLASMLKRRS